VAFCFSSGGMQANAAQTRRSVLCRRRWRRNQFNKLFSWVINRRSVSEQFLALAHKRHRQRYTRSVSALPRNLRPIRLSRRPEPFDSDDYIFELKIDGFRSLAYVENGQCDLVSRNGNTFHNFKIWRSGSAKTCAWRMPSSTARSRVSTILVDRYSTT
jgi:ATP-dependent DNA ligase